MGRPTEPTPVSLWSCRSAVGESGASSTDPHLLQGGHARLSTYSRIINQLPRAILSRRREGTMDRVFEVAAGIDVHRDTVVVSVRRQVRRAEEVETRTFETFH